MSRRFVLHAHSGHGPLHYDLMLESGDALATWRLPRDPTAADETPLPARRIGDHRREYLTCVGPVSGGRGRVEAIDAGDCEALVEQDARWEFQLHGQRLSGRFELLRDPADPGAWTLRRVSSPPSPPSSSP